MPITPRIAPRHAQIETLITHTHHATHCATPRANRDTHHAYPSRHALRHATRKWRHSSRIPITPRIAPRHAQIEILITHTHHAKHCATPRANGDTHHAYPSRHALCNATRKWRHSSRIPITPRIAPRHAQTETLVKHTQHATHCATPRANGDSRHAYPARHALCHATRKWRQSSRIPSTPRIVPRHAQMETLVTHTNHATHCATPRANGDTRHAYPSRHALRHATRKWRHSSRIPITPRIAPRHAQIETLVTHTHHATHCATPRPRGDTRPAYPSRHALRHATRKWRHSLKQLELPVWRCSAIPSSTRVSQLSSTDADCLDFAGVIRISPSTD